MPSRRPLLSASLLLAAFTIGVSPLSAQTSAAELVEVTEVSFDQVDRDWIAMTITLEAGRNSIPTARSEDFIEDVKVSAILSWQIENGTFDFYTAEVDIIALERREEVDVHFLLPGIIVRRDEIDSEPFAWLVELEVGGNALPITQDKVSESLRSPAAVESLKNNAQEQAGDNDGLLMPIYLAPPGLIRVDGDRLPAYLRKEAE